MSGQLRICGGNLRSRQISVPKSGVRPTSDRVREAVFSTLYSLIGELEHKKVLDAFAGSGALGIEALSRGAEFCCFYEKNSKTQAVLSRNLQKCGLEQHTKLIAAPAEKALAADHSIYDLIFIDPPYALEFKTSFWELIAKKSNIETLLCVERSKRSQDLWPDYLHLLKEKVYGDTRLSYFRIKENS